MGDDLNILKNCGRLVLEETKLSRWLRPRSEGHRRQHCRTSLNPRMFSLILCTFLILWALTFCNGLVTLHARAATLDCSGKATEVERMICSNPRLATLDQELSDVYRKALPLAVHPEALAKKQEEWTRAQRTQSDDEESLEASYLAWIEEIRLSPGVKEKFFASQPPPPSIFGRYSEKEPICINDPDSGNYDCTQQRNEESYIDIQPGSVNSVKIKSKLIFLQGQDCAIEGEAEWVNGVLRLPALASSHCVLQLRFTANKVSIEDPANECKWSFCDTSGAFDGIELPKVHPELKWQQNAK